MHFITFGSNNKLKSKYFLLTNFVVANNLTEYLKKKSLLNIVEIVLRIFLHENSYNAIYFIVTSVRKGCKYFQNEKIIDEKRNR